MRGEWRRLRKSHTPAFAADMMILETALHLQGPTALSGVRGPWKAVLNFSCLVALWGSRMPGRLLAGAGGQASSLVNSCHSCFAEVPMTCPCLHFGKAGWRRMKPRSVLYLTWASGRQTPLGYLYCP